MGLMQTLMIAGAMLALLLLGYYGVYENMRSRSQTRRLDKIRARHALNESAKVEAQLKKAVAARKPRRRKGGADSRLDALVLRLERTGDKWSVSQYLYISAGLTVIVAALTLLKTGAVFLSLFAGLAIGLGLPHWIVGFMIKRRLDQFNTRFPDAIELLVRGLRSGLPVTETMGVVAHEVPGPVGAEFRGVVDGVKVGRTLDDALQQTANRLNIPEFQFFCISLAIQRETGGNLAETLSNLAEVLRKRAQMKLKIKAMSSESKASAYIVGSLPFIVFTLVYLLNPDYLGGFFVDDRLIVAGIIGAVWMSIGAFIMYKMVSFEI
ncbi:type II secretion system F family protein [uncultured Croceicoccus sp.]|uniref:type II secretion system F family protein n=1 Tax=uncultured Croceicoccus sp. TaxID=1295329 RepID=UPI00260E7DBC|nr:type II secretion system F family protein [uncultured Croceicoccus sp.]